MLIQLGAVVKTPSFFAISSYEKIPPDISLSLIIFVFVKDGLCPIHIAAHYGHVEATEVLLAKGVDTDSRARVKTIFH